jgi:phosphinothricin acetyltransferase
VIRPARLGDAAAIAAVYAPHVLTGTASFETEAPSAAEMAARMARVAGHGWPWLVWEAGGAVLGYAYASQFRDRPAYRATCENSIYVAAGCERRGIGRALLLALVDAARGCGFGQMIAVIGDAAGNHGSTGLHRACGFVDAGRLVAVGNKFGRWLDVAYMQRTL